MKCRHNLRIRIVITRTSKHHQDIVEGTKSSPDLISEGLLFGQYRWLCITLDMSRHINSD